MELKAESDTSSPRLGSINVRLSVDDQIGALAISSARQDSEQSGLLPSTDATGGNSPLHSALKGVILKLEIFVDIVDKTSKVSANSYRRTGE